MSKLADHIRKATRREPVPLGFAATAARKPSATMLALLRLSAKELEKLPEETAKVADLIILENSGIPKRKEVTDRASERVLGVALDDADGQGLQAQREAGADFVVLDLQTASAEAILEEEMALVIAAGHDLSDTQLRLLDDLPAEALLVSLPSPALNLAQLLELRRFSALARKPLLVNVPGDVTSAQLHALRNSGVIGVVLDGADADKLPEVGQKIMSLPPRGRRREERNDAVLPPQAHAHSAGDHEEEEDGLARRRSSSP